MKKTDVFGIIKRWLKLMLIVSILIAMIIIWFIIFNMIYRETLCGYIFSAIYLISTVCLVATLLTNEQINNFIEKHFLS